MLRGDRIYSRRIRKAIMGWVTTLPWRSSKERMILVRTEVVDTSIVTSGLKGKENAEFSVDANETTLRIFFDVKRNEASAHNSGRWVTWILCLI